MFTVFPPLWFNRFRSALVKVLFVALTLAFVVGFFLLSANAASRPEANFSPKQNDTIVSFGIDNEYGAFKFYRSGNIPAGTSAEEGWVVENGGRRYRVYAEKMKLLLDSFVEIPVRRVLDSELGVYGLSRPTAAVSVETTHARYEYYFGNNGADYNSVYAKNGEGIIVLVGSSAANQVTGNLAAYRDKNVFTVDLLNLAAVEYSRAGKKVITLRREGPLEWYMDYPWRVPARHIELSEFVSAMTRWIVAGYPEDTVSTVTAPAFATGLVPPLESLTLTDMNGKTQTLDLGVFDGLNRYVRIGEYDDVVYLYAIDADLSGLDPLKLLFVAPLRAMLDEVSDIHVEAGGKSWDFAYNPASGAVFWDSGAVYDLGSDEYVSVFFKFISMTAAGHDDAGMAYAKPVAFLSMKCFNGKKATLEFLPRNETTYFMRINGENTPYFINAERLDGLLRRINGLAESRKTGTPRAGPGEISLRDVGGT